MNDLGFKGYDELHNQSLLFGLEMSLIEALEQFDWCNEDGCVLCDAPLDEFVHVDFVDGDFSSPVLLCCNCAVTQSELFNRSAELFALEVCEITEDLPTFKWESVWRCTPEEFANGCRDRFEDGMYFSYYRQGCTNYMELIEDLNELSAADQIYFVHVRRRIDELISRKLLDMSHNYIDQLFPHTHEQRQGERCIDFLSDQVSSMILAHLEARNQSNGEHRK